MARRRHLLPGTCLLTVLGACGDAVGPLTNPDIHYIVERFEVIQATTGWAPFPIAYLEADLAMVNAGTRTLDLQYGACALQLEGVEGGSGRIWRSQGRQSWPLSILIGCLLYQAGARLAPGDTLRPGELRTRVPLADILADSLPVGGYGFSADVRMGDAEQRVELGEIHLPRSRFPLQERVAHRDGFRYEVRVAREEPAAGGRISVALDVALSVSQTLARTLSASCPVRILAYADPTEAISIPMAEPAWIWPTTCGSGEQVIRLGPGEDAALEGEIDPRALGITPGLYSLVAVVEVDDRPLRVLAGEVDVAP